METKLPARQVTMLSQSCQKSKHSHAVNWTWFSFERSTGPLRVNMSINNEKCAVKNMYFTREKRKDVRTELMNSMQPAVILIFYQYRFFCFSTFELPNWFQQFCFSYLKILFNQIEFDMFSKRSLYKKLHLRAPQREHFWCEWSVFQSNSIT